VVARRTTTVAEEATGTRGGVVARKTSEHARRTPGVVAFTAVQLSLTVLQINAPWRVALVPAAGGPVGL
jgi:hypothetical protein